MSRPSLGVRGVLAAVGLWAAACQPDAGVRAVQEEATGRLGEACQGPTSETAAGCVLEGDATLDAPLEPAANTTLNCRGHRLLPRVPRVDDDPATIANDHQASDP